jgi:HNH endonuclease
VADEIWKEYSRHPGYFFSSHGRAGRMKQDGSMRVLRGCTAGQMGYRAISVPQHGGKPVRVYIHRGVCELFNGPCQPGMQCRHLNGNMLDNRPENLKWGTSQENNRDKIAHGTAPVGELNGGAKLTRDAVQAMRQMRQDCGTTFKQLAVRFGVSTMTAFRATVGQSWN